MQDTFEYYINRLLKKSLIPQEIKELSSIILKDTCINKHITTHTIEIEMHEKRDFPFELIGNAERGILLHSNLIVRKFSQNRKKSNERRIIKIKGFIDTKNPIPLLIYHGFEKTAFYILMKSIGNEFATIHKGDKKKRASYILENCEVLHLTGHSMEQEGTLAFQIDGKDGIYLTEKDVEKLERVPEFIWMNTCNSNRWAELFLRKGCHAFIGTSSNISDSFAEKIAGEFYTHFSNGECVGYSYFKMTQRFLDFPEILKMRFYGDQFYRLREIDGC